MTMGELAMKRIRIYLILTIALLSLSNTAKAQYIEDALRYSTPNAVITQRSGALGIAYQGIADDFAALLLNPAGLALISNSELSVGFGFQGNSNTTKFQGIETPFSANDAYLSHVGLVGPFQTKLGNAAVGLGYLLESNFNNTYEYSGFNPNNTMIGYQAKYGTRNINDNWAYHTWVANDKLSTPIVDSLQQSAFVQEKGGLHDIVGGAAFELGSNVSAGFNLIGKFGNYEYSRNYSENDSYNKYKQFDTLTWSDLDFNSLTIDESIDQSVFGFTANFGLQARIGDFMRLSGNINFPTFYSFSEKYSIYAQTKFDDGWEPNPYDPAEPFEIAYYLTTPFKYSAGASFNLVGVTVSAGIEYMDASQIEFSDANGDHVTNIDDISRYFDRLNQTILKDLVGQVTWGIGAEWELPGLPLVVRGSYQVTSSPYSIDISGAARTTLAFGAGFYPAPNVRLDGLFRFVNHSELRTNYGNSVYGSNYTMDMSPTNFGIQLTYRY
jgi:hypothetical protein